MIIVNNPCIEYWFLLHFEQTAKLYDTCAKAEKQLKKHIPDYEKKQKYFTKQGKDIYLRLKPHIKTALENVSKLGHFDSENPLKAMCEMHLLFSSDEMKKHYYKEETPVKNG